MRKATLKVLALGGVGGPVLFTAVTLFCASLRPDYNHISQFISELGATDTPNATFMNFAGFIPSGLMIVAFGVSLMLMLPKYRLSLIGSVLIIVFGFGMVVVGNFSCDIGCPRVGSLENNIHDQISGPIFLCGIMGILLLGISFRKIATLRGLWIFSVVSGLLALSFVVALINSIEVYTYTGMWQRLLLFTIFLWLAIVGWKLFKSPRDMEVDSPL